MKLLATAAAVCAVAGASALFAALLERKSVACVLPALFAALILEGGASIKLTSITNVNKRPCSV